MTTADSKRLINFDEFCEVIDGEHKADLIDGEIYMASPDNTDANDLAGWLYAILRLFVRARDLGKVYVNRVAFRLDKWNSPEPDIAFVRKSRLNRVRRGAVQGPPDLAVEVVSPDSIDRDYEKKRDQYERAGVREYWILDELSKTVTLLRLARGKLREVPVKQGVFLSRAVPGFWFKPAWLWQNPLPDEMKTLQQIRRRRHGK
jgi:Uma2 family endonuclease